MASEPIHRPLIPLAVALMAGIAGGAWFPGHPIPVILLAAAAFAGIVRAIAADRSAIVAPLVLLVSLGYLSIQPWLDPRFGAGHAVGFVEKGPVPIVGRVLDVPHVVAGRQKFHLAICAGSDRKPPGPDHGKIRVTVQGTSPAFAMGDCLRFVARLRSPRNFNNPGGFDYRRYLFLQGIQASTYVIAERVERIARGSGKGPPGALDAFRRRVGGLLERSLDADRAAVLGALTIGDRHRIDPELRSAFNRVGVGHLLAISGLHVGIVAGLIYGLLFRGLAWLSFLLERGWTRKAASLGTAVAVWGYAVLAGLSPSTQRAALMISVFLAAMLIERERDLPNTLALAALIILAVHPPAFFSVSFQLSFLAVAWIVAGVYPAKAPVGDVAWTRRWTGRVWTWSRQSFCVSLWAALGTLPVVMQTFNQVSLVGVAANLIFIPLIGMLVVPSALAATALVPISVALAVFFFQVAGALLALSLSLLRILAAWPASAVGTFTPRWEEIVLFYAALALGLAWMRMRWPAGSGWRRGRTWICLLVVAGILGDGLYWGYRRFWHPDLRATVLDVGQGSATVLELPGGAVVLVDGGGFSDNAIFDMGQRVVAPFLRYQKIRTVDLVVLTHPNADHLNGLLYVMAHFPVGAVWSNHEAADTLGYRQFVDTIRQRNLPWPPFESLPRRSLLGRTRIDLLHPGPDFDRLSTGIAGDNVNNNSMVIKASSAKGAILLTGDIEVPAEGELVKRAGADLAAEVLVVPHHGSQTSGSAALLAAVRPWDAIISCGWHNPYGMPHRQVLERLSASGARVWRTDRQGALSVIISSRGVKVVPFLVGPESR